jgi:hypothetical protein
VRLFFPPALELHTDNRGICLHETPESSRHLWMVRAGALAWLRWIRYNRPGQRANDIYTDGHVERLRWGNARFDQFPDHRVRRRLDGPPE